jgi:hypothetical protein
MNPLSRSSTTHARPRLVASDVVVLSRSVAVANEVQLSVALHEADIKELVRVVARNNKVNTTITAGAEAEVDAASAGEITTSHNVIVMPQSTSDLTGPCAKRLTSRGCPS